MEINKSWARRKSLVIWRQSFSKENFMFNLFLGTQLEVIQNQGINFAVSSERENTHYMTPVVSIDTNSSNGFLFVTRLLFIVSQKFLG